MRSSLHRDRLDTHLDTLSDIHRISPCSEGLRLPPLERSFKRSSSTHLERIALITALALLSFVVGCVDTVVLSEDNEEKSGGLSAGESADFPGAPNTPLPNPVAGTMAINAGTPVAEAGVEAGVGPGVEAGVEAGVAAGVDDAGTGALSCLPGERLGLCLECAPGNTTRVPRTDEECPVIDCDAMSSYDLIGDTSGYVECRLISRGPGESMCQYENVCYREPEAYCTDLSEEVVLTSNDLDECFEIAGCRDNLEPEQVPATGASCNGGRGICNDLGECEDTVTCESMVNLSYNSRNVVCDDRLATDNSCDYYVHKDNNPFRSGNDLSCDDFCSSLGGSCVRAWDERDNSCDTNGSKSCDDRFGDAICRCSP